MGSLVSVLGGLRFLRRRVDGGPIMGWLIQRVNMPVPMLRPAVNEEGANRCEAGSGEVVLGDRSGRAFGRQWLVARVCSEYMPVL